MSQMRLILMGLGVLLIAGVWWFSARRTSQASGREAFREREPAPEPRPTAVAPVSSNATPAGTDWGVSPLEPLVIKTAQFEPVPVLDVPMRADAPPEPPRVETAPPEKIISLRVGAVGAARWPGAKLLAALTEEGLVHGRYQVFHRLDGDGASLFSVASLFEPGSFDLQRMPHQEFRGVTLFAVLPGPLDGLQTVNLMLAAARGLAERLGGMAQDTSGVPLSPQRAAVLLEEVAQFQADLA